MTESEYSGLEEFRNLPLCEEKDDKCCRSVDSHNDPDFTGAVYEAGTVEDAKKYLADSTLVPKGAIKYSDDTGVTVRAYFWKKR